MYYQIMQTPNLRFDLDKLEGCGSSIPNLPDPVCGVAGQVLFSQCLSADK